MDPLDNGFFRARWDRATRTEREFMAAMSVDGDAPSETGIVAKRLSKAINSLGPARANLIAEGVGMGTRTRSDRVHRARNVGVHRTRNESHLVRSDRLVGDHI